MYEEENIEPEFLKRTKTNPFRTPEHYFDSIEDRIMGGIRPEERKKASSSRIIQLLKPALGLVAGLAIVYLLVYHPGNQVSQKRQAIAETTDTTSTDSLDNYAFSVYSIDERTLANAIFGGEAADSTKINTDEMLAYLSTDMTDLEIYTEIQK